MPDHLDLQPRPSELPKDLRVPQFTKQLPSESDKIGNQATTVFPPDDRQVFSDTSYPWSTIGRIDTPVGFGTGIMVGPRHVLTVSHIIQWLDDNRTGWIEFRPSFFPPSAPFGEAWGDSTLGSVYYKVKVEGPWIDNYEGMYDYVVVVLNRDIGNSTGWMGSKSYTDAWDGSAYWSHAGYPQDLTAGNRPVFQNSIALDGDSSEEDAHESMDHTGDVWPGQSGGPFFAWWADGWPYVIAVQSWQNSSFNGASGGADLVDLINRARNDHP
jgi:V8-like Glu-specific endopeptidase